MKKLLPLMSAALLCGSFAQAGVTLTKEAGLMLSHISPNGEWAVSCGDGNFYLVNLKTDEYYEPEADESNSDLFYEAGYGNPISNDGIVVGSTTYNGQAAYYVYGADGGQWIDLPALSATSCAHGITPDGSRIVGYSMRSGTTYGDDAVITVPLLWQRNDAGSYEMVELPYPTLDFTGIRTPQYVIALAISADGHQIAGQVTDYAGWFHSPILFTEDNDGNWSYRYLAKQTQTLGKEFPEWHPYDGPSYPQIETYLSDEETVAYEEAYQAWKDSGYTTTYPQYKDYMTEEEYAQYTADIETYKAAYNEWSEMNDAFYDVYWSLVSEGAPDFLMNSIAFSADGSKVGLTEASGDYFSGYTYVPGFVDTLTDEYKNFDATASVTYINNDGDMLGVDAGLDGYSRFAYAKPHDADNFVRLNEYVKSQDEEAYNWMVENMTVTYIAGWADSGDDDDDWGMLLARPKSPKADGDTDDSFGGFAGDDDNFGVDSGDDDNFGVDTGDGDDDNFGVDTGDGDDEGEDDGYLWVTDIMDGLPVASDDFKTIVAWTLNMYAENEDDYIYSVVYRFGEEDGIGRVAATNNGLSIKAGSNGVVYLNGTATSVDIYDIAGHKVYSTKAPASVINTNLASGVYIIKAKASNGKSVVAKAAFTTKA
jgi:hypothetical protein